MVMPKTSSQLIFDQNKSQVLNAIRDKGPISRIELTRETGISAPTVTRIVKSLMNSHLVKNLGLGNSSGGRPPVILEFDPDSSYVIGIEWEFTRIKGIVANLDDKIICEKVNSHDLSRDIEKDLQIIVGLIEELMKEAPLAASRLKGIGISAAGYINKVTGTIEFSPVQSWQNIDVKTPLEERFSVPIFIDHQSRVMALSEYLYGDAADMRDLLFLNLSFGMGAGFMIDGNVIQGFDGFSGEIGHTYMPPPPGYSSRNCLCGKENCLAEYVSGRGLARTAGDILKEESGSVLFDFCKGDTGELTAEMVLEGAEQGDGLCCRILDDAGRLLGLALANISNIMNPQVIVIGGTLSHSSYYIRKIRESFEKHGLVGSPRKIELKRSSLIDNAAVRGAAALVLQNILNFNESV